MWRSFIIFALFLFSLSFANASPLYQIDMIVFTHLQLPSSSTENVYSPILAPDIQNAIPLSSTISNNKTPYHALPKSASELRDEHWALNRKPQYQILFHRSWLQPGNNQKPIALFEMNVGGWNVEGTLKIKQSNYYLLDTELLFSAPNSKQRAFIFAQKQRLKPGVVYYLDHPHAGMLIKIHQVA